MGIECNSWLPKLFLKNFKMEDKFSTRQPLPLFLLKKPRTMEAAADEKGTNVCQVEISVCILLFRVIRNTTESIRGK